MLLWLAFAVIVLAALSLDLGVFHKKSHAVSVKEALVWTGVWVLLALLFGVGLTLARGSRAGMEFLSGYLLEESLSADNIFAFILVMKFFKVEPRRQHRVLFWGILGAVALRLTFIATAVGLLDRFHWLIYLFGGFLVYTGVKMGLSPEKEAAAEDQFVIRAASRWLPVSKSFSGDRFFVKLRGRWAATPLFMALAAVDVMDVVFAVDSIPAVLAVTRDPLIVTTSNIFAILGLRSLYFAIAGLLPLFRFLNYGLAFILSFVGLKMLLSGFYPISIGLSLGIIVMTLAVSIAASLLIPAPRSHARR